MKGLLVATAVVLSFTAPEVVAGGVKMQPGIWEWSMNMEVPGMPMAMPPTVYSSCVSKEDLVPRQAAQDGHCKTVKNEVKGNRVHWKIECTSPGGPSTSEGTMTYSGNTAKGVINSTAQGMTMKSTLTGRRTGPCR